MKPSENVLLVLLACFLFAEPLLADGEPSYTDQIGERVTVFESKALNYRLDLGSEAYTFVDFSKQVPEASFAEFALSQMYFRWSSSSTLVPTLGRSNMPNSSLLPCRND